MKKSVLSFILGLSVLTFGIFSSCEVGLGSAVDTEAPVPVFAENTVGSGAVIRDAFIVHGTWTDDGEIKELKATLSSTSGAHLAFNADGKIETQSSGKGTWSVVFDPSASKIPDGSYELSLTMTDTGKHSSTITRSLVIDNTPPLVVLTRPGTKLSDSSFDSYGQKFTLEGKAADDNDVSLVEVNVYSDAARTNLLKTIPISNVPLTIDLDVAEFSATEVNDYTAIYDILKNGLADKEGGTATRYCSLNIYDGSQRYPADGSAQTDADKLGNHTSTYYVNDDTIAELFTQYKITELYHILNKSFGSSSGRSISVDSVKTKLTQQAITGSQFTINPENSPTFVVNSRSPLEDGENLDEAKYQITSGLNTLQVEISAGLDKHAIKKDTIGIYVRECDNLGNVADSAPKIWLIRPVPVEGEDNQDAVTGAHDANKVEIVQSGTTFKFTTVDTLTPVNFTGLDVSKYYKVYVVGKDVMKNSVLPKDNAVYAFNLKPDTQVINLSVTNVTPDWLSTSANSNAASKEYKAKVTFSGGDAVSYEVFRKFDDGTYESLGVQTSPFWDTFKTIDETNHQGVTWAPSVITYQVKGNNDSISSELPLTERQYDNTQPNVAVIAEGIPTVTDTQQATITFKGTADDIIGSGAQAAEQSGVKAVYVQIIDEADTNKKTPAYGQDGAIKASYSGGEWLCQIKPSDYKGTNGAFEDEGPKRLVVTAVDGVGLKKSVTVDSTHKVGGKNFIYDSAAPVISLTDYQLKKNATTWENPDTLVNNDSLLVGKLFKINGTLTEKYGLAATDGFIIEQKYTSFETGASTTGPIKKSISVTSPANAASWSIQLPFTSDGTNPANGTYEYVIKAKDKAGKDDNSGISFTAILNTQGPAVSVTAPEFTSAKVTKYWQKTRDIMVSGKASSPATITGIYWTIDGTKTEGGNWTGWTKAEGSNNWNFTVSYDSDKADHKLYIAAIDELGNITEKATYTLKVDATNPTVSPKFFQLGTGAIQQATDTIYVSGIAANKKDLTVYGTYNGSVSGYYQGTDHETLEFKINNVLVASKGTNKKVDITYSDGDVTTANNPASLSFTATPTANTKSWKAVFDKSVLANGGFSVTARNNAGLTKENSDLTIVSDAVLPEFGSLITITKSSFDKTESGYDCYYVNNSAVTTISGTASDANLLSVDIKKEGGSTLGTLNNNPFNWSFNVDMRTGWSDGDAAIVTITDKAGNTTAKKFKFTYDTTPPVAQHDWDNNNKDAVFRIGEANNDLDELHIWNSSITALADQDKNVGGKYTNKTFGNAETIRIRGDFEDAGSGVATVYYKLFASTPTPAQIQAFIDNPENEKSGNAILPTEKTQRVSYTNSNGTRIFKDIKTTYTTLISDLKANDANYIAIVAVDKVGNVGYDFAEKSNESAKAVASSYYTLNIDTISPTYKKDYAVTTQGYVNPGLTTVPDIQIAGLVNSGLLDNGSAPTKAANVFVELKVNGKRILATTDDNYSTYSTNGKIDLTDSGTKSFKESAIATATNVTCSATNVYWKATIKPKVVFSGATTGSYAVDAIVTDGAGNKQTFNVGTINVDTTLPIVTINTISDADKDTSDKVDVNGTLEITGTASDSEKLASVKVEYQKSGTSTWTTQTQESGSTPNNWKVKLNTTSLDDKASYIVRVTATDEAGNTKSETKTIYVNQDSDRPIVKFTNLTKEGNSYILKYGTNASLEGTVTDDDATSTAVVTKFLASTSSITSASGWTENPTGTWTHTSGDVTKFNPATGDFTFTPANKADGPKTVYFYIENNGTNKTYYTNTSTATGASLTRPKYQYKTDAPEDNNKALSYKSDGNAPKIKSVELKAYTAASGDNTQTGAATALGSNCIVGGPSKKYVDINVTANDGNGIKGVVVILEQTGKTTIYYRSNTNVSETGASSYTASTAVASSTTSADYVYATSRLDISGYNEAPVNVTIKVYDQSGLYSNQESMFVVDNTAPTLTIENVNDGDIVYGIKKNTVGGTINGATDVEKIYYAVTKDKVNNVAVASNSIAAADWIEVTGQKISAKIIFGGTNADSAIGQIDQSLRQYLMDIYGYDADYMLAHDENLNLSIHFKAVDACGNTGYSKRTLEVVPNGDKPTITLSYPVDLSENTHPALAGTIRVYGNAEVAEGSVAAVYVQIDTNYNATNGFNASGWKTGFDSCISGKGTNYTVEQIGNRTDLLGVKATGTLNWNLPINGNKEFDPPKVNGVVTGSRAMAIRIYGVGGSGKVSEYVEQVFTVDPNAPHIGGDGTVDSVMQLKLVQLDNSGNITNQRPYKSGDWVTGQWYVAASVYDDSGIKSITLDQNDGYEKIKIVDGAVKQTAYTRKNQADYQLIKVSDNDCHEAITTGTGKKNFDIYIPLPTTEGSGSVNFTIEAVELAVNANSSTENIKINYDNTPPKLGTVGHTNYNASAYNVQQDNGFYHLFGYATDAESGSVVSDMKAVAFYFVRRGTANTRVYDPMWKDKYVAIQTGTNNTTGISYEYGMFWNSKTVGRTADLSVLTLSEKDDNIHAGGFVLLEGTIYTIREVSENGKTITLKTEAPAGITTAKFAYAMVIDNFNVTESTDDRTKITDSTKYGYGYYAPKASNPTSADDGDLMQEKWASGKWEAWINSANIPDGPIEIHYVALDNAQNYSVGIVGNLDYNTYKSKTTLDVAANGDKATPANGLISGFDYIYNANTKAYVSNNAPRIAGVKIGCDFNGDTNITSDEKINKYVRLGNVLINGEAQSKVLEVDSKFIASDNGTKTGGPVMVVKDKTSVELEIIGGNGNLYYQYNIDSSYKEHSEIATANFTKNNTAINVTRTTGEGLNEEYNYYVTSTLSPITFENSTLTTAVNGTNKPLWFTIELWDSTEETTKFSNSQYAELKLNLDVQVLDTTAPNTVFNDLYWNSSTDNSVYTNPSTDKLEGHIDLKGALTGSTFGTTGGYGTDDDKVSGKVVFRGYAYDNKRLKSLTWGIKNALTGTIKQAWPQTSADGTVQYVTPVPYNTASGKWGTKSGEGANETWSYSSGNPDVSSAPFYYFKVYDDAEHGAYLNENGHKVYWELTIDTSHVQEPGEISDDAWAVGKNLYVYVQATDNADRTTNMNPTVVTTGTDAQKIRPNYKVDVVPYITGIKSRLSDNRSSNGRYQLADNETGVELIGYNLKVGSANLAIDTLPTASGAYSTEIHGCVTINNLNNNEAVGNITDTTEAAKVRNKYNYQPSTYNDSLTDDVYIQLWQFNNRAAQTNTGVGFIREPAMAFNPTNGQIGFAFSNGANKFSMARGRANNPYSYQLWEMNYARYVCNGLAFDESGYSHGISVGIDTEPSSGKAGRMNYFYSRWGRSDYDDREGNFNNENNLHIDTIGIPNANNYTSTTPTGGNNQWGTTVIVEERFNSVSIQAVNHTVNGTTSPTVYIAYYDDVLERIVFRYGTVGTTVQAYDDLTTTNEGSHSFPITKYSLIAGGKNVAGTAALTPYNAGEYVALDVVRGNSIANDVVCVVWYDAIRDCLMYNYKTNPCNDYNADTTHTTTSGYWAEAKVLKEKCGQYCKIAVDANGGIHIAAYDSGNKGVGYVYLPSYNASYSEANNYYLIDAMNGPFDELGLAVAVDGTGATGKAYPTISYYANGTPKMATYSAGITKPAATNPAMPAASWANGKYTGNWDVCYVPSASQLIKDHVNVVQPHNTNGVIARVSTTNNFSSTGETDNGTVTGNTTTNPILGYAIREGSKGYLEIAQRK